MASKYTLLILLPAALLVVWFLLGLLRRKKPTRFALNNVLSLVLLAYFLAVTGTGIFWVAVQELPVFDWHYLPGYILLILGLLHVALHWKNVSLFLRRGAPKSLKTESGNFRGWIRGGGYALLAICIGVILFFIGAQHGARSITVVYSTPGEAQNDGDALHKPGIKKETMVEPTMIKSEGKTLPLAQYYHLGSAYPARSKLSGVTWKTRPALHKEYPGKAKVPLPVIKPDNGGSIIEAFNTWRKGNHRLEISSMTLDNLALLLYHTQGISKVLKLPGREFGLRTAPSAGALFPVNIYVAVNRVAGLDQGLYYYHVKDDSLIRLREGQTHHRLESVSGSPHLFRPAAATIIMTSTFGRSGFKYLERSYRYVNMDTGHAAYNLGLCAASLGYAAPMTSRFDDGALNEFLEVDGKEEAALLLLALGQPAAASTTPLPEPRFQLAGGGKIRDTAVTFLQLIHHNTTFRRTGNWTSLGIQRKPEQFPALKEGDIAMPKPLHGLELYPAIRKRRSVRRYSDAPIKIEELAALCDAAEGTAAEDSSFFSLSPGISLYAVVKDVTGVPSGVYRYNARDRSLRLLEKGDFSNRCFQASYKQDFCGTADVVFMKTLKWEQAAYPDGDRNYRYACIHAGIVGEGLYLQASALDIGVCGVGAFLDFEVAAILKILPENEVPLYLTAVGK